MDVCTNTMYKYMPFCVCFIRSLCCTCILYHSSEFMITYFFFEGGVIPSQDRGKNQDSRGTEALVGG